MSGSLRRHSLRSVQLLLRGRAGASPSISAGISSLNDLCSPTDTAGQPRTGAAAHLLTFRSGFATSPAHLQSSLPFTSSDGAEVPSTSTEVLDTSEAISSGQPAAEVAQAADSTAALSQTAGEAAALGVDPTQILQAASHAEQAAMLLAYQDSGWNIFNAGFQALLTSAHDFTGLPWWVTIAVTALTARTLLLPVTVAQVRNTHKMSQARPDMLALRDWYTQETERGNQAAKTQYQERMAQVWRKHDCNPLKSMASIFVQVPLFIGFFGAIRSMATAQVPSLTHGGALWFTDLTVADPTYALPVLCSAMILLTVELGAADGMQGQDPALMRNMKLGMRFVSFILIPVTASMPQGVFVYWITSSVWSLAQALGAFRWQLRDLVAQGSFAYDLFCAAVFKIRGVRSWLGLPPLRQIPVTTATGIPVAGMPVGKPVTTYKLKPRKGA